MIRVQLTIAHAIFYLVTKCLIKLLVAFSYLAPLLSRIENIREGNENVTV